MNNYHCFVCVIMWRYIDVVVTNVTLYWRGCDKSSIFFTRNVLLFVPHFSVFAFHVIFFWEVDSPIKNQQ